MCVRVIVVIITVNNYIPGKALYNPSEVGAVIFLVLQRRKLVIER